MNTQAILQEIHDKYGEWLEMAGDDAPAKMIQILACLLIRAREDNDFLRMELKYVRIGAGLKRMVAIEEVQDRSE